MCLLSFFPAGAEVDISALENGAAANPDGHGFAIAANSGLLVERGMDPGLVIDQFLAARHRHADCPALFHSRFATHGAVNEGNCHPFRLGGDPRTVLAHNGVLPAAARPTKGDRRCDTRIAAEEILPGGRFGPLYTQDARAQVAEWITRANKLVVLTVDTRYRDRAYILNEDAGVWDGGVWYSNDDYRLHQRYLPWFWGRCENCVAEGTIDADYGYCLQCGACADCGESEEACLCFVPNDQLRAASLDEQSVPERA